MTDEDGTPPSRECAMLEDLAVRLRDAFQARTDKTIFVKAAGTIPYGRVVEAMDIARGAGAERIGIMFDAAAGSLPQ